MQNFSRLGAVRRNVDAGARRAGRVAHIWVLILRFGRKRIIRAPYMPAFCAGICGAPCICVSDGFDFQKAARNQTVRISKE